MPGNSSHKQYPVRSVVSYAVIDNYLSVTALIYHNDVTRYRLKQHNLNGDIDIIGGFFGIAVKITTIQLVLTIYNYIDFVKSQG